MAQFLEMRYSRKFRIFAGILCWVSGIINFGIFPAVGTEFFMNMWNLPDNLVLLGTTLPTYPLLMALLLGIALFFTFVSGQIGVIVTDFWQGFFATFAFVALIIFLWNTFSWDQIGTALVTVSKPGNSLINPFEIKDRPDFGVVYFLISVWLNIYYTGAWQGASAYQSSAITAHEAKMSPIVGSFRQAIVGLGLILMPLCALAYMNLPEFADKAAVVTSQLETNYPGVINEHLRFRMLVPTVMNHVLPQGLVGAFVAVMLGYFICTNSTYMHSWGTILIQDVVCPLRKKTLSNEKHLMLLKLSISFVAVFALAFSLLFKLQDYIQMFIQITGAIYMGGAGAAVLGGLYWKRGSTYGAWTALIIGAVLSLAFIILQQFQWFIPCLDETLPIWKWDGMKFGFLTGLIALLSYVVVSLLGPKHVADMDKLLHRGKYAIQEEQQEFKKHAEHKKLKWYWRVIGVKSDEFSFIDRLLFAYTFLMRFVWDMGGFFVTFGLALLGFMSDGRWLAWWRINLCISAGLACIGAVWISLGGLYDLKQLYKRLGNIHLNALDDGRVAHGHNLADEEVSEVDVKKS
jgi:SSS family solute:Na+ symporter